MNKIPFFCPALQFGDAAPWNDMHGNEWNGLVLGQSKDNWSFLLQQLQPANESVKAETGRTRYVLLFADGSADKLVIEQEVTYVRYLIGAVYYSTSLAGLIALETLAAIHLEIIAFSPLSTWLLNIVWDASRTKLFC